MPEGSSAIAWARTVDTRRPVPLAEAEHRVRIDAGVERRDSCAQTALEAVAWLAPLVGLAIFLTHGTRVLEMEPVPPEVAVPAAGIAFAIAALGPPLTLVRWARRGRRRTGLTMGADVWTLVLAVAGGIAMALSAGRGDVEPGLWGTTPWIAAALALLALGAQLIASSPPPDPAAQRDLDERMLRERSAVLDVLAERGAIDAGTRARAEGLPFGDLQQLDRERWKRAQS